MTIDADGGRTRPSLLSFVCLTDPHGKLQAAVTCNGAERRGACSPAAPAAPRKHVGRRAAHRVYLPEAARPPGKHRAA
jgi:hypothetical protein